MASYFIREDGLAGLMEQSEGKSTFVPSVTPKLGWLDLSDSQGVPEAISDPRTAQSPKGCFLPAAESVGRYGPAAPGATATERRASVVVGIRSCELKALKYLDKVMLEGEFDDPAYRARREATVLVSCDCVSYTETCFCTLVGERPYPTEGFDVNLTPVEGGYIAEAATQKGQDWLNASQQTDLVAASEQQLKKRDEIRQAATEAVIRQNARFGFSADDENQPELPNDADPAWQQFAADCVECGACTNICPTCHCFYLYDQVLGREQFERVRNWDSCLLSTYHRMAGGVSMKLTPHPDLFGRLANRVLHKFTYSPQQYGMLGCVGCGRCIDACLGAIDIREVVDKLSK